MIKNKSAITEATMNIGVIIGGGTSKEIEALGSFGKTFSVLFALRDEFIDTYEIDEVVNRYRNECLPLPILLTFKKPQKAKEITRVLTKEAITEADVEALLDLVIDSKETDQLRQEMTSMIKTEKRNLDSIKQHKDTFTILIEAMMEDL